MTLALGLIIIAASRWPLLNLGYGTDPDAWRVASAARSIANEGAYTASRLPGYPLHELACSLFWHLGPVGLNTFTALMGGLSALLFALIARRIGLDHGWLAGLSLLFVPVIYVASAQTIDYVWALAFILASVLAMVYDRSWLAGILLGCAIGCRITSGVAGVALLFLCQGGFLSRAWWRRAAMLALFAVLVGLAWYAPVLRAYGLGFWRWIEVAEYPDASEILQKLTIEAWGVAGLFGMALAALGVARQAFRGEGRSVERGPALAGASASRRLLCWTAMVLLHLAIYLRLPHEVEYMIPAVPFVLLIALELAPASLARIMLVAMLVSPFVALDESGHLSPGAILEHSADRQETMDKVDGMLEALTELDGKRVVVGWTWTPHLTQTAIDDGLNLPAQLVLEHHIDQAQYDAYAQEGYAFSYLEGAAYGNRLHNGLDLVALGAELLQPD